VPGSPLDPRAEGTNGLIKQGATPVTETADIVAVLQPIMGLKEPAPDLEPADGDRDQDRDQDHDQATEPETVERARIVALMSPTPVSIDDLVRLANAAPRIVRMVLLELEIAGRLQRHGGGLVSLL
jgi:DNA processing protein